LARTGQKEPQKSIGQMKQALQIEYKQTRL